MNAIAKVLARAKAAAAPRIEPAERVALTRRVRPRDRSCAGGFVLSEEGGWITWFGDDGIDHQSRPDYLEPETA